MYNMMSTKLQDLTWNREMLVDGYKDLFKITQVDAIKRLQDDLADDLIDAQDIENTKTDPDDA